MEQSAIANHEAAGHDMARNKEGTQPLCPLEYGLDIFNGKWKTRIICLLGASGTLRYKEIRDMVNDQIVDRRQYNEIPPRVEYSLSEKGASAHKILRSICCWAVRYCPLPEESLPPCKKVGGCPL
ncbi:MAG: helix-turn-helix domain-containing protein [Desulfovibrio sp.]|nr:helix-turn-helix domain-containing protein [Desulfovibrio sp.]